jgi:Zn finger protein HypA/HybF involved in hydrogenase expression
MSLHGHGRSTMRTTNGRPLCPDCRLPLWLVCIEEHETEDRHSFECPRCGHMRTERRAPIR